MYLDSLSPTSGKDAELLNRQFPFDIDLNKILPVVRTKAEKPDIHFYIPVQWHAQFGSKLAKYVLDCFQKKLLKVKNNQ